MERNFVEIDIIRESSVKYGVGTTTMLVNWKAGSKVVNHASTTTTLLLNEMYFSCRAFLLFFYTQFANKPSAERIFLRKVK